MTESQGTLLVLLGCCASHQPTPVDMTSILLGAAFRRSDMGPDYTLLTFIKVISPLSRCPGNLQRAKTSFAFGKATSFKGDAQKQGLDRGVCM